MDEMDATVEEVINVTLPDIEETQIWDGEQDKVTVYNILRSVGKTHWRRVSV